MSGVPQVLAQQRASYLMASETTSVSMYCEYCCIIEAALFKTGVIEVSGSALSVSRARRAIYVPSGSTVRMLPFFAVKAL